MKTILSKPNTLANQVKALYSKPAQQKAVGLVLADYQFSKRTVRYKGFFFVRIISMRSHFMAKLERDTFTCASDFESLSANPFQLCHQLLGSKWQSSFNLKGAH